MNKTIKYRIRDSHKGWVEVETNYWLADALKKSGVRQPHRVQFRSKHCWKTVSDHAVNAAVKAAWGSEVVEAS